MDDKSETAENVLRLRDTVEAEKGALLPESYLSIREDRDRDDEYDYDYSDPYCARCNNTGWIVTCPDDLCQSGEPGESCIHGDGDELCPDCHGRNAV